MASHQGIMRPLAQPSTKEPDPPQPTSPERTDRGAGGKAPELKTGNDLVAVSHQMQEYRVVLRDHTGQTDEILPSLKLQQEGPTQPHMKPPPLPLNGAVNSNQLKLHDGGQYKRQKTGLVGNTMVTPQHSIDVDGKDSVNTKDPSTDARDAEVSSGEERMKRWRGAPTAWFEHNFRKINDAPMYLLSVKDAEELGGPAIEFQLACDTMITEFSNYLVRISKIPSCTCKYRESKSGRSFCKHIIYVLVHILKVTDPLCWQDAFLTKELVEFFAPIHRVSPVRRALCSSGGAMFAPDGDCPVCFQNLDGSESMNCSSCGTNIHVRCSDTSAFDTSGDASLKCVACLNIETLDAEDVTKDAENAAIDALVREVEEAMESSKAAAQAQTYAKQAQKCATEAIESAKEAVAKAVVAVTKAQKNMEAATGQVAIRKRKASVEMDGNDEGGSYENGNFLFEEEDADYLHYAYLKEICPD